MPSQPLVIGRIESPAYISQQGGVSLNSLKERTIQEHPISDGADAGQGLRRRQQIGHFFFFSSLHPRMLRYDIDDRHHKKTKPDHHDGRGRGWGWGWAETNPPGRSLSPDKHTTATLDLLKDKTEQPLKRDTAGRASDWVPRLGR